MKWADRTGDIILASNTGLAAMNKIVFCDIDGTLMDGFRGMMDVSDRTMYALQELSKQAMSS